MKEPTQQQNAIAFVIRRVVAGPDIDMAAHILNTLAAALTEDDFHMIGLQLNEKAADMLGHALHAHTLEDSGDDD